jgi:hydrogenase nickel incorporation protein HypB
MKIEIVRRIMEKNENAAKENRARLDAYGIRCMNLLGGAGCGKTAVLETLIPMLTESLRVAVLEGDLATTRDAERIARLGVPVIQLLTEGGCHLTASLVQQGMDRLPLESVDLLFIENVGNPICPGNFDLGEHGRVSVLSVTEGDDKPDKYSLLFKDSALILITKCDLLSQTDFQIASAERSLRRVNSNAQILRTSARSAVGFDSLASWMMGQCLQLV